MRFFLTGKWSRQRELLETKRALEDAGHEVSVKWIERCGSELSREELAEVAEECVTAIRDCDMLVSLGVHGDDRRHESRPERLVEIGIAIGMGRQVIMLGHSYTTYAHSPFVRVYPRVEHFLEAMHDPADL